MDVSSVDAISTEAQGRLAVSPERAPARPSDAPSPQSVRAEETVEKAIQEVSGIGKHVDVYA